jgi:hypothetical protein
LVEYDDLGPPLIRRLLAAVLNATLPRELRKLQRVGEAW